MTGSAGGSAGPDRAPGDQDGSAGRPAPGPAAEPATFGASVAGPGRAGSGLRRREIATAVAVLVVLLAAIVALWPRGRSGDGVGQAPGPVPPTTAVDLMGARAAAALRPCPAPTTHPGAAPAPELSAVRAVCLGDGSTIDLGAALAGRPVLINVWASWCGPCREELPALDAYAARPGAIPVLGVQVQSSAADGLGLLRRLGVHFPSVVDLDGSVQHALRVPSVLPVSYLLAPDGRLTRVTDPAVFTGPDQIAHTVQTSLGVGG